jgi:DNA-binding transcriptional ArsR family regulator
MPLHSDPMGSDEALFVGAALCGLDRTVHEPARLAILAVLRGFESADFLFVLRQTGLTKGNLSSHLSKLEEAGYVEIRKEFVDKVPRTLLSLTDVGRSAFETYRRGMTRVLTDLG